MKCKIEIECPEGYTPKYDIETQKVTFYKEVRLKDVKTFEDVLDVMNMFKSSIQAIEEKIPSVSLINKYKCDLILSALHSVENYIIPNDLTVGNVYYPIPRFYKRGQEPEHKDNIIGMFRHKRTTYVLVGGYANYGSTGLGCFNSYGEVGRVWTLVGFLPCATREIAEHFSRYFGRFMFDALYADRVSYTFLNE
jgi:hypothetical protein